MLRREAATFASMVVSPSKGYSCCWVVWWKLLVFDVRGGLTMGACCCSFTGFYLRTLTLLTLTCRRVPNTIVL